MNDEEPLTSTKRFLSRFTFGLGFGVFGPESPIIQGFFGPKAPNPKPNENCPKNHLVLVLVKRLRCVAVGTHFMVIRFIPSRCDGPAFCCAIYQVSRRSFGASPIPTQISSFDCSHPDSNPPANSVVKMISGGIVLSSIFQNEGQRDVVTTVYCTIKASRNTRDTDIISLEVNSPWKIKSIQDGYTGQMITLLVKDTNTIVGLVVTLDKLST